MSKTRIICHIVFATKGRRMTIPELHKKELYAYIFGILRNKRCHLYRMNGVGNHLHMLVDLHPSVALADLVREIKSCSARRMCGHADFPAFEGWAKEYFAATVGLDGVEACRRYIMNQEEHHRGASLLDEMERMSAACGLACYADDWR